MTHHEAFSSGSGKHRLEADGVQTGPALLLAYRGFELVGKKEVFIPPGTTMTDFVECELK